MDLYKIGNDFEYIDLSFINKEDVRLYASFKGQPISDTWHEDVFELSEDKLQKGKSSDFEARCYGSTLIVQKEFEPEFKGRLDGNIEVKPIKVKGINKPFIFINLLNVIPAINFEGVSTQESMKLIRENNIPFDLSIVKEELLFRDVKLSFYYCTDAFVDFVKSLGIKGLKFEVAGKAALKN
ncbi:hypothetical protein [Chitinophaga sp. HK235]|uniref:hypothetical protein n=1 Tax=Chitinophaga sp. HK235 TaxID=2952571 RepID=UPI001BA7CC07|nr:hypothetical protein [Chitinophaga sp. HK235]